MLLYTAVLSVCLYSTTCALPVAIAGRKDSKFCCHCAVGEDGEKKGDGKIITTDLGAGTFGTSGIKTVNVLTSSLTGCDGLLASSSITGGASGGGLISSGGGLLTSGMMVPSMQMQVPQAVVSPMQIQVPQAAVSMQFPAPVNVMSSLQMQQPMLNLQSLQPVQSLTQLCQPSLCQPLSTFVNVQQPKFNTQCCAPCENGKGICCCIPGATTTTTPVPRDIYTLYPPYQPSSGQVPSAIVAVFACVLTTFLVTVNIL